MDRLWEAYTFNGLVAILEDPKVTVAKSCQAVEECISSNKDNLRGFFEQCFAPLVARIFGYSGPSWLGQVVRGGKENDARALLRLLSPSGPLFTAMYSADADGSIRFHFPRQRLPTHTQMMLATSAGIKALGAWPQYSGALEDTAAVGKGHIHVSVFQYFCYWFAFYAIKGGDGGTGDGPLSGVGGGSAFGVSVRRAADALHLTSSRGKEVAALTSHPYIALIRQLIDEMVPRPLFGNAAAGHAQSPSRVSPSMRNGGRSSGGPGYSSATRSSSTTKRGAGAASRGLLFYSILIEFWLKDADEPVPLGSTRSGGGGGGGGGFGAASLWSASYEPPSEDLLEALGEIVRYVTVAPTSSGGQARPAQGATSWLPPTPVLNIMTLPSTSSSGSISPPHGRAGGSLTPGPPLLGAAGQAGAQTLSRQLYRFFYRAFTMWPDQRTMKPLLKAFLTYVAPWQTAAPRAPAAYLPGGAAGAAAAGGTNAAAATSTSQFTAHVSELVTRVGWMDSHLAKEVGGDKGGGFGSEWEVHVLANLPFYLELVPLFLERSISRISVRGETAAQDVKLVIGTFEAAAGLLDILRQVERDFNRFCASSQQRRAEGPYAELLPWLMVQAQDWQVAATASGDSPDVPSMTSPPRYAMFTVSADRCAALTGKDVLDLSAGMLKPEALNRLKRTLERVLPIAELAEMPGAMPSAQPPAAATAGTAARLPRSNWRDVRYKGDPLRKPVTSYEIGPLVRILVVVSEAINSALGLDRSGDGDGKLVVENRAQEAVVRMRRSGMKVNLRPLADVRTMIWLPLLWWIGVVLVRVLCWVVYTSVWTGLGDV